MCLELKTSTPHSTLQTVYKLYKKEFYDAKISDEKFTSGVSVRNFYVSMKTFLKRGKAVKSDRAGRNLTRQEKLTGRIEYGIHVFTNKEEAIARAAYNTNGNRYQSRIVVECTAQARHFVGEGVFESMIGDFGSAVYTQVTPRKIIHQC